MSPTPSQIPARNPIAATYFLFYAALGVLGPFLSGYLRSLGLSGTEVGFLLTTGPIGNLIFPSVWASVAARSGRADRVLRILTLGAPVAFAFSLVFSSFWALLVTFAIYSAFGSAISTVLDLLSVQRVKATGDSYARLRLWGSIGFLVTCVVFGIAHPEADSGVIVVALGLLAIMPMSAAFVRSVQPPSSRARIFDAVDLLRDPRFAMLVAWTAAHWFTHAPWNGLFAAHALSVGLSNTTVGVAVAVGVVVEIGVMQWAPSFFARGSPLFWLLVSFAAGAARWTVMAFATSPAVVIGVSALHGLTFALFHVSNVEWIRTEIPEERRAHAQAIYMSAYGLGGLLGIVVAGRLFDVAGSSAMWLVAAAMEGVPILLVARMMRGQKAGESR